MGTRASELNRRLEFEKRQARGVIFILGGVAPGTCLERAETILTLAANPQQLPPT